MERKMGTIRVNFALKYAVLPEADIKYERGDQVFICRERMFAGRFGEYQGLYLVSE